MKINGWSEQMWAERLNFPSDSSLIGGWSIWFQIDEAQDFGEFIKGRKRPDVDQLTVQLAHFVAVSAEIEAEREAKVAAIDLLHNERPHMAAFSDNFNENGAMSLEWIQLRPLGCLKFFKLAAATRAESRDPSPPSARVKLVGPWLVGGAWSHGKWMTRRICQLPGHEQWNSTISLKLIAGHWVTTLFVRSTASPSRIRVKRLWMVLKSHLAAWIRLFKKISSVSSEKGL